MSRLLDLRQAVIEQLKTALGAQWDVAGHLGRFSAADLNAFLVKAPAVRVAVLGVGDAVRTADEDGMEVIARLAIYVVTRDQGARLGREEIAVAAVETIMLLALGNHWSVPGARPAGAPTSQTIFNADTLAKGVALWAIELAQPMILDRPGVDEPNPLGELYLGLAPDIGPEHIDDYEGPITGS